MKKAIISIGSNLGCRISQINKGIRLLKPFGNIIQTSFMYETKPMYVEKSPKFLNCAILFETKLSQFKFLNKLK